MPSKGRPPPPPKPEELIEILDKKFEAYKEEMRETIESKSNEILQLREQHQEQMDSVNIQIEELKQSLEKSQQDQDSKMKDLDSNQKALVAELKKNIQSQVAGDIQEIRDCLGIYIYIIWRGARLGSFSFNII